MTLLEDFCFKSECYYNHRRLRGVLRVLLTDGSSAVILYRIAQFFVRIGLRLVAAIILEINKFFNGCVIGRHAEFGEGLVLMHPIGVVINGNVKGGRRIVIESGVVIGAARNGLPVEVPILGNGIFIGSGAKILGGIRIGNNVKIGANAVVLKDLPDGATAVGIPAKIVRIEDKKV